MPRNPEKNLRAWIDRGMTIDADIEVPVNVKMPFDNWQFLIMAARNAGESVDSFVAQILINSDELISSANDRKG